MNKLLKVIKVQCTDSSTYYLKFKFGKPITYEILGKFMSPHSCILKVKYDHITYLY